MANLTQEEFLTIADLYPKSINLWCTSGSLVTALGVTVPFVDNENIEVRNTLQQMETITLPVDNDSGTSVEFTVTSRVIRGIPPFEYFFFTVEPKNIDPYVNPTANEVVQDGEVILSPNLRGGSFFTSNYNVVLNTTQNNRTSDYIQQSTSTTLASIQDSLYSDTGWVNARYDGTPTNSQTYLSIESAILGSSLEGTYYPIQTSDTEINNIDISERSYLEYFHNSLQPYPSSSVEKPALFNLNQNYTITNSVLVAYPELSNRPIITYQPGDLLKKSEQGTEVMKVVSMTRLTAANDYRLEVIRGWNNTTRETFQNGDLLYKLGSIRMFELEKNKPSPVKQGKIRLKDTGYIVYTDLLGYVISGSTPPVI
jgi:hypothetical protein